MTDVAQAQASCHANPEHLLPRQGSTNLTKYFKSYKGGLQDFHLPIFQALLLRWVQHHVPAVVCALFMLRALLLFAAPAECVLRHRPTPTLPSSGASARHLLVATASLPNTCYVSCALAVCAAYVLLPPALSLPARHARLRTTMNAFFGDMTWESYST